MIQINHPAQDVPDLDKISDASTDALIDTGSNVTSPWRYLFFKNEFVVVNCYTINVTGFGIGNTKPLGSFPSEIEIDNNVFQPLSM